MTAHATLWQRALRVVRHNAGLKLFSLIVSAGLFAVVHGSEAGQRSLYVPVLALLPASDSGKILVGDIPDKVKLTLSGSRSVLNSVDAVDTVQIDLTDAKKYYYFDSRQFGLPAGINVEVSPSVLALQWEERVQKKIGVRAQVTGAPPPNLELVGVASAIPPSILISGPRSSVELITEVVTEPLSLLELTTGVHRRRLPLLPLPKHVTSKDQRDVIVQVELEPRREQRRLRRLPVMVTGTPAVATLRPIHVDLLISAASSVAEGIDPEHLIPVVELGGIDFSAGPVSVPVRIRGLPDDVKVVRVEPSEIMVRVR